MNSIYKDYRSRYLIISGMLISIVALVSVFEFFEAQFSEEMVALWIYIAILFLLGLLVLWGTSYLSLPHEKNDAKWLHPPTLLTIWVILSLGLPGLLGFFEDDYLFSLRASVGIDWEYFVWGWVLIFLGLISLWFGYILGLQWLRPIQALANYSNRIPSFIVVQVLYGMAVILSLISISITGISFGADRASWGVLEPFTQSIGYISETRYIILALVALQVFYGEWSQRKLWPFLIIELILAIATGFMKPTLFIALIILSAAYFTRVKLTELFRYALLFTIVGILIVPVIQRLRFQYGDYDNRSILSVLQAAGDSFDESWGEGIETGSELFSEKMGGRQASLAHHPGVIIKKTPAIIPYQGLKEFLVIPASLIPRFLWPNKPVISKGVWFSITYMNMPTGTNTSSGFTIFGEPYIYAGWGATVVALLALGMLLAFVYHNTINVDLVAVYIALIPVFIDVDSQFTAQFISILQRFVVYMGIYLIVMALSTLKTRQEDSPSVLTLTNS